MNHIPVAKRNFKKYDSVNKKIINEIKKIHIYIWNSYSSTQTCVSLKLNTFPTLMNKFNVLQIAG